MVNTESSARHHAILIGLNHYPSQETWKQLTGCVNDVQCISFFLKELLPSVSIHKLISTSPDNSDKSDSQTMKDRENLPTWENVEACLKKIISEAQQGDFVYIHYSGHGTVIPPSGKFSNYTTGDLALVLLDGNHSSQNRYFYGEELGQYLQAMVEKRLTVTLVLDTCYSGTTLRSDESVRSVEFETEVFERFPPTLTKSHTGVAYAGTATDLSLNDNGSTSRQNFRDASMRHNWLLDPSGYTIITACGPTGKAYEAKFDEKKHGVLSFYMQEAFDMLNQRFGDAGCSVEQIYQHVRVRVRECRQGAQSPMLFGGVSERPFFFGRQFPADIARGGGCSCCSSGVIAVVRKEATDVAARNIDGGSSVERAILELQAGAAHGISIGDRFELRSLDTLSSSGPIRDEECDCGFTTESASLKATVLAVEPLSSLLHVDDCAQAVARCRTGWLAVSRTRLLLRSFSARVCRRVGGIEGGHISDDGEVWRKAAQEFQSLEVRLNGAGTEDDSSILLISDDGLNYKIADGSTPHLVYWGAEVVGGPCTTHRDLLRMTQHLAWFKLVWSLTNIALVEDAKHPFHNAFNAYIHVAQAPSGDGKIYPGCRLAPDCVCLKCNCHGCNCRKCNWHKVCTHPECVINTSHGEKFKLVVENLEPKDGLRIYVHVFDMGSRWQVENALRANHEEIPPCDAGNEHGAYSKGKWTKGLKWEVPPDLRQKGKKECEDVIKVFLTTLPTSFTSLTLPKLGERVRHDNPYAQSDRGRGGSNSEYWAAINFRVRTVYE